MIEASLLYWLIPVVCVAGFVRGLTGFGGPLILMPLFIVFIPASSAAAIVMIVDMFANVGILLDAIRKAARRWLAPIVFSSLLAMPVGSAVMVSSNPDTVKLIVYVAVGISALILMSGFRFKRPLSGIGKLACGATAGGVMGATALGVIIVPIAMSSMDSARTCRANIIVWVFCCSVALIVLLFWKGGVGAGELISGLVLAPAYLLGAIIGKRFFGRIDEARFRRFVLVFLCLIALAGILTI